MIRQLLVYSESSSSITTINLEHFLTPRNLAPWLSFPNLSNPSPLPQTQATMNIVSVFLNLPLSDISYNGIIQYVVLCFWFPLFSILFIHVSSILQHISVVYFMTEQHLTVWTFFLTYPSVDGYLSSFHFWAVMNNVDIKFMYKFFCGLMFSFFFGMFLEVELLGRMTIW